jgi:hypothetical protein
MNRYREWAPPTDLAGLVECFWTRRDDGTAPAGVVLPDGCIDIIFYGEHVGIGPKQLSRILRFRNAAAAIRNGEPSSLAEVAATFGYSDQAHMNREFRELAGVPPTALRA